MTQKNRGALITLIVGLIWVIATYAGGSNDPGKTPPHQETAPTPIAPSTTTAIATQERHVTLYPVVHVVDGDTIDVLKGGEKVRVRLIGINTPESVDPRRPIECFGIEASNEMKRLLTGQSVSLETDPSQDTYDKYGRLLAYVYLPDSSNPSEQVGTDAGLHMIENGFAYEYTYRLPYAYQDQYRAAQRAAQAAERGLWTPGACGN